MSSVQATAMRPMSQPGLVGLSEKPNPGMEGTTTWKASAGDPPCATGSVSGPITSRNSNTDPGQPWHSSSGSASGSGERVCRKWMPNPSISVRYWPNPSSTASARRQS